MRNQRDVNRVVLQKMLYYCNQIEKHINQVDASYEVYISDTMFRKAVDMCIIQIGELTTRLTDDFKAQHSEIPWRAIKAIRNVFVHDYEEVNLESAWRDLTEDVPNLKTQLTKILSAEAESK